MTCVRTFTKADLDGLKACNDLETVSGKYDCVKEIV